MSIHFWSDKAGNFGIEEVLDSGSWPVLLFLPEEEGPLEVSDTFNEEMVAVPGIPGLYVRPALLEKP